MVSLERARSGTAAAAACMAVKVQQYRLAAVLLLLVALAGAIAMLSSHPPAATTSPGGSSRKVFAGSASSGQAQDEARELQGVFEHIYEEKLWSTAGNGSGAGSTVEATSRIRAILLEAITDLDVYSLIDVPCGAMAWMPLVLEEVESTRPKFKYLGLDIAASVVEQNKQVFRDKRNWEFAALDMASQPLPRGYDLIHTRDALMHLSCRHGVAALQNLANSGAKYLLVGSYDADDNKDIEDGQWFSINLRLPPYSLARPLGVFDDELIDGFTKHMLLYSIAELQKEDFQAMKLRCSPHAV